MFNKPALMLIGNFSDILILPACKQESYIVVHCIYVCQYIYRCKPKVCIGNLSLPVSVSACFDSVCKFCEVK